MRIKHIVLLSAPLLMTVGCATTTPASQTTSNFGVATAHNKAVHAIPATDQQKQNTFIPADRARQDLARKRYREDEVEEPVAVGTTN